MTASEIACACMGHIVLSDGVCLACGRAFNTEPVASLPRARVVTSKKPKQTEKR